MHLNQHFFTLLNELLLWYLLQLTTILLINNLMANCDSQTNDLIYK